MTTPSSHEVPAVEPDAETLRDHWWWRPGWQVGTRFLAFHITVADLPALADHVAAYQRVLSPFAFLDPIPRQWLHITVQGLDHADAVTATQRDDVTAAVAAQLAALPEPRLRFAGPVAHGEAIVIPPTDPAPLCGVRQAIRDGIAASYGPPEGAPMSAYRPHTSVAYVNAPADPHPVREALDAATIPPVDVTATHVSLIEMHRDHRMYEWQLITRLPLGPG